MRGRFRVFCGQCEHGQQLYGVHRKHVERGQRCERVCGVERVELPHGGRVQCGQRQHGLFVCSVYGEHLERGCGRERLCGLVVLHV